MEVLSDRDLNEMREEARRVIDSPSEAEFYADRGDAGAPNLVSLAEKVVELVDALALMRVALIEAIGDLLEGEAKNREWAEASVEDYLRRAKAGS